MKEIVENGSRKFALCFAFHRCCGSSGIVSLLTCFHSKSNLHNFKSNFYLSLFVQCENEKKKKMKVRNCCRKVHTCISQYLVKL